MPPKRKTKRKPPKRSKSQSQSQRQSVTINLNKTTPAKKKRSGRGGLPPPSYQQNLFPPTIIQQQAPNIAVLENQISRLTSMIQEPTGIKQPATPLSADTGAKAKTAEAQVQTTEAQKMAQEQAEPRRPGPTAENFQSQPSRARTLSQDLEGFDAISFEGSDLSMPYSMRKRPPSPVSSIPSNLFQDELRSQSSSIQGTQGSVDKSLQFINQFDPATAFGNLRPVSDRVPPNMGEGGQGEGGGNIPFAQSKLKRGRPFDDPTKLTQATPASKRAEELPIRIVTTPAPRQYSKKELQALTLPERNKIFKAVNITGEGKMKQYLDLYKFGEA